MRPDPERARLAAEALARARADAWARGDRPGTPQRQQNQTRDSEREGLTQEATLSPSWSARPRRDDPQPLTAAVGGLLSARGWRERAAVGAVFGHWLDIVGPQLALHTKPESFDAGELTVSADSPAWATQLRLMAPQLLKRLAEELGHGTVRHIRVNGPSGPPRRAGRLRVRLPVPFSDVSWAFGKKPDHSDVPACGQIQSQPETRCPWKAVCGSGCLAPRPSPKPCDTSSDTYRQGGPECR
jgi:predicted nucleic acid-binding Zn ribbon protein